MAAPHPGPDASGQAGASRDDATCVSNECPGRGEKARRTNFSVPIIFDFECRDFAICVAFVSSLV